MFFEQRAGASASGAGAPEQRTSGALAGRELRPPRERRPSGTSTARWRRCIGTSTKTKGHKQTQNETNTPRAPRAVPLRRDSIFWAAAGRDDSFQDWGPLDHQLPVACAGLIACAFHDPMACVSPTAYIDPVACADPHGLAPMRAAAVEGASSGCGIVAGEWIGASRGIGRGHGSVASH